MRRMIHVLGAVLAAFAIAACGDDGSPSEPSPVALDQRCAEAESPPNIVNVTAKRGLDCAVVEDAMGQVRGIGKRFQLGDFACARTSGSKFSGVWTCVDPNKQTFTFDFAD